MKRDSFVFYRSFYECVSELPEDNRLSVYEAIFRFALDGEEPKNIDGVSMALFKAFKPQILANYRKYENGCKGGRGNKKANENQNESKQEPNESKHKRNDNDNDNDNDNENGNVSGSAPLHSDIEALSLSILSFLNDKTGSHYKLTDEVRDLISSKLDDGYTEADFKTVIENKSSEWSCDGKMRAYIRPSTLFGPKFEEYLNAPPPIVEEKPQREDPHKRLDELRVKRAALVAAGASKQELEVVDLNIASIEDALEAENG